MSKTELFTLPNEMAVCLMFTHTVDDTSIYHVPSVINLEVILFLSHSLELLSPTYFTAQVLLMLPYDIF